MDPTRIREDPQNAKRGSRHLANDLKGESVPGDALRACEKFCSHGGSFDRREIDHLQSDSRQI